MSRDAAPRLRGLYVIVANTAILLWIVLAATHFGLTALDAWHTNAAATRRSEAELRNYSHMTPADRDDLLRSVRRVRFRYEPVVGFLHQAFASRFVNVDAYGIRSNGAGPRPIASLQGAVWMLGGSTTFGFGVADSETIPARLEADLGRPVVNLGVNHFSSLEDTLLLAAYLRDGYRPAAAVFLDGINEACSTDAHAEGLSRLVEAVQDRRWDVGEPAALAFTRFAAVVRRQLGLASDPDAEPFTLDCVRRGRAVPLKALVGAILAERRALCEHYAIACHTFIQPFAGTHGRIDDIDPAFLNGRARELGAVFTHLEPVWRDAGAEFLTHALDGVAAHPFIDDVHYSADTNRILAAAIAAHLRPADRP